jgi:acetyltransferase
MRKIEYPDLEVLFRPKSIAIAWVSSDLNKIGGLALKYLIKQGYKGKIYPVNPKNSEVQGIKCYPSIEAIPQDIDVALLVMRAQDVAPVLRQCIQKGAKAAAVPVIGFSEVGGEGKKRQDEIEDICKSSGLRICGPNTNGLLNLVDGVALGYSPAHEYVIRGRLGFVTQSGALISALVPRFANNGIGLSYFIAAGNQLNLDVCDYTRYLLDDPNTDVIALYIEGIKDADKFLDVADLALNKKKPLIVMKIGRSELAAKTAISHTASLVGSDRVFDAICKQKGLIRVHDFDSLISVCSVFLNCKLPKGEGVGVLSTSGAATSLIADHGMGQGLYFPELSTRTRQEALTILPGWPASGKMTNLWDLPAALPGRMEDLSRRAVELFVQDENFDVILTILAG